VRYQVTVISAEQRSHRILPRHFKHNITHLIGMGMVVRQTIGPRLKVYQSAFHPTKTRLTMRPIYSTRRRPDTMAKIEAAIEVILQVTHDLVITIVRKYDLTIAGDSDLVADAINKKTNL